MRPPASVDLAGQSLGLQPMGARRPHRACSWARYGMEGMFAGGRAGFAYDDPCAPMARLTSVLVRPRWARRPLMADVPPLTSPSTARRRRASCRRPAQYRQDGEAPASA